MAKARRTESHEALLKSLHFEVSSTDVAYKRITECLRGLILSKAFAPGTRLPTLSELSKLWNTNYYTAQTALTPLVNEGLLVRRQRTGTFIAGNTRQMKAVGIYFGCSLWRVKHAAFYQALYAGLCDHFEHLGIGVHLFMDSRPTARQGTPFKPLVDAMACSEVNGVIGAMYSAPEAAWLEKLTGPVSLLGAPGIHSAVDFGYRDFLRNSLLRLKARKCRSVALICAAALPGYDAFLNTAKRLGLKSRPEWMFRRDFWPEDFEEFGFNCVSKIWSGTTRPDGLIVYPDSIAMGVIMGLLQQGIKVPDQLKLVLHCNEEVYFHCPLPVDWHVVSIAKIVDALWKHLRLQADGNAPRQIPLQLSLQPASPDAPPMLRKWISGNPRIHNEGPNP